MKTSDNFTADEIESVLLVGPPGSGKTNVAMGFPDPYFISTDHKISNAVRRYPGKKFFYDWADERDGKQLEPGLRWGRIGELIIEAGKSPDVKTIVLDNLTDVGDWLQEYLLTQNALSKGGRPKVAGMSIMEQGDWQPYYVLMTRMITAIKSFKKRVVVCAHEAVDKDEVSGTLTYYPLIGGKLRNTLSSMFNNVWQCSVSQTGPDTHRYFVKTKPTPRMMLINSFGLPAEFEFSWDELAKKMGNTNVITK